MLELLPESAISKFCLVTIIVCVVFLQSSYFNRGLNRFSGPWLAKFSQVWLFLDTKRGQHHKTIVKLHKKYGDIVRTGPNVLSLADPADIKVVYGFAKRLNKSQFYAPFTPHGVKSNVFSELDDRVHEAIRKPLMGAYSMTSLTNYEPYIDKQIEVFLNRLGEEFGAQERTCEMDQWFQYYAFDVIAAITWGHEYGFMREAWDVDNSIQDMKNDLDYKAAMGQMPWLDVLASKNPVAQRLFARRFPYVGKTIGLVKQRRAMKSSSHTDILQTFLDMHEAKPDSFPEMAIYGVLFANWNAGSDTTAITLRAVLYYVLRTPGVLARLMEELNSANLSSPVTWKEGQQLVYLDACVKEAMRVHPGVGLGLERVAPVEGLTLTDGTRLQGGTVVSMNAWVVHRNKDVFGIDAHQYNPDRWLPGKDESESAFQARYNDMRRHDFTFGAGTRTCIGKNISLIEIYKVIPSLLLKFDIQLAEPDKEWVTKNSFFVFQTGLNCTLKRRLGDRSFETKETAHT